MPPSLYEKSLLLVTRIDKILTERDRTKVLRRLTAETEGLFSGLFPISLVAAVAAGDDVEKWVESGAEAFTDRLIDLVQELVSEKENSAQNTDQFEYGTEYVVPENSAQSTVERMSENPVGLEEEPVHDLLANQDYEDEDDSYFDDAYETVTEVAAEENPDMSVLSQLNGAVSDPAAVDGFEEAFEQEVEPTPLTLTNRVDQDAPASTPKSDLLPPLNPIEETAPTGSVMPRRVRRLSSDGTPRSSQRPARPMTAVDDVSNTARPKASLSPLNSLSNLRGVFANDNVQSGHDET